jgi:aminopeptidase N
MKQYLVFPLLLCLAAPALAQTADTLARYQPSATQEHDLRHARIELSFDWAKRRALGRATLTLSPWFYATDRVTLDAKNFDIKSVALAGQENKPLQYDYDNEKLTVRLGRTVTRNDEYKLVIQYTAKPYERASVGGSAAIQSDRGLYFINHDGKEAGKPRQIWTQGETESNSHWMPTIDKPNERCTQEMYLTVEDKYRTLSNGLLVSSKKNADGTRTDYWKMDQPHAPYLFMMAIGEYTVTKDKWRGKDVDYYVEPKYAAQARDVFPYTVEMLEFFSNRLGVPYPWSKFAQVPVRDYVSGAMENTTAVIFGEFMYDRIGERYGQALANESIVAHEMFHQWFGDLVTTESWANLTLNEGFATYGPYLWYEHKYGVEEADREMMDIHQNYEQSAEHQGRHALVNFGYDDRESMFDGHSYQKGAAILHMLRRQLGDDAFFAGVKRYLDKNAYTDVEAHELRLAMEDVSGRDLQWFFNQWFYQAGHPVVTVTYGYDEAAKKASVTVEQTQEGKDVPRVFDLPLAVDIYSADGKARREPIRVTARRQTFTFDVAERPAALDFDGDKVLLAAITDRHTPEEWAFLYRHSPLLRGRREALYGLRSNENAGAAAQAVFVEALRDRHWSARERALLGIKPTNAAAMEAVATLAEKDPSPAVRSTALSLLGQTGDRRYAELLRRAAQPDQPEAVFETALPSWWLVDSVAAAAAARGLESSDDPVVIRTLANVYGQHPNAAQLAFFERHLDRQNHSYTGAVYSAYSKVLARHGGPAAYETAIDRLKKAALDANRQKWMRFYAAEALYSLRQQMLRKNDSARAEQLLRSLEEVRAAEQDPELQRYYAQFVKRV